MFLSFVFVVFILTVVFTFIPFVTVAFFAIDLGNDALLVSPASVWRLMNLTSLQRCKSIQINTTGMDVNDPSR